MSTPISVLKFGSSVLPSTRALGEAVREIYRELRGGRRVVAVVSAFGRTTDRLLARARRVAPEPDDAALALYLSTGEHASVAALTLALRRSGISAEAIESGDLGLRTLGSRLDAAPDSLDSTRIRRALERHSVAVVPGFVGRDASGRTTLLGRGGSDASAIFLAAELRAERCRLLKDVDGVYDGDPATQRDARRFASLSWDAALAHGGGVVQEKAIELARRRRLAFEVAALGSRHSTHIGDLPTIVAGPWTDRPPTRVVLIGLGNVGSGVHRELAARPNAFELRRVVVRDLERPRADRVAGERLTRDVDAALAEPCDLVVELTCDAELALRAAETALSRGRDFVTASKRLVAVHGPHLEQLARAHGGRFACSAAVGGSVPMLEVANEAASREPIESFEGVLNATTNFVVDAIAAGADLAEAVRRARERGLCERDVAQDLDGLDAADKVEILARRLWNRPVEWESGARLDASAVERVRAAARRSHPARFVASCRLDGYRAVARLDLRELEPDHALADVSGAGNALALRTRSGRVELWTGEGAGRWPTTESVLGDVLELARTRPVSALSEAS